ncbi:MAG: periplasmic sensor signal transduction histidine kinase [Geminicoccaceae bacterium]|nr:periplasmic sensor signal transduction histidine kinase [Geminicoccaceae bacterium]
MSFRSRLLIAFALATIVPLGLLAFGVRRQLTTRLVAQHQQRIQGLARVVAQDVDRESASIAARLASITRALRTDDRFRLGALRQDGDRAYVLDWGEQAMRTAGLSMMQLQDADGRIVSSGHFRNEFDRLEPELPSSVRQAPNGVLVRARTPEGPFLALARVDSVRIGDRRFDLVGGVRVDSAFLQRFAREEGLVISLVTPTDTLSSRTPLPSRAERGIAVVPKEGPLYREERDSSTSRALRARSARNDRSGDVVAELALPYASIDDSLQVTPARLTIASTIPELDALRRDVDRWFLGALVLVVTAALVLAGWLSARLSGPLTNLAHAMSSIDLDSPDIAIAAGRDDELGTLARRLGAMSTRLRASAARLRQAERRATVGDMARQVNHDIKNGLIPIRNVLRHLVQVQEQDPGQLPTVFAERRATLESSVGYLDTLARNYARLTPRVEHRAVDVNGIAREIAASTATTGGINIRTRLADALPRANGDPVIVRRILDNLVRNAVESLDGKGGDVTITTARTREGAIRIIIDDTGRGMSEDELAHVFDDFYTTKPDGTGLGLSVVRRLTADLHGAVRVESAPGKGTTFTIELPSCTPS